MSQLKRLEISFEVLKDMFGPGDHLHGYSIIADPIPEDATLLNVRHSWPNGIELLIRSSEFSDVPEKDVIPVLEIRAERKTE